MVPNLGKLILNVSWQPEWQNSGKCTVRSWHCSNQDCLYSTQVFCMAYDEERERIPEVVVAVVGVVRMLPDPKSEILSLADVIGRALTIQNVHARALYVSVILHVQPLSVSVSHLADMSWPHRTARLQNLGLGLGLFNLHLLLLLGIARPRIARRVKAAKADQHE